MLIYVGLGPREYGDLPIPVIGRRGWEFQAVLEGAITPMYAEGPDFPGRRKLWLFPPELAHGWSAEKNSRAEIVVFHYLSIPEPLLSLARKSPAPLSMSLDADRCRRLRALAAKAAHYWKTPSPAMMICHEEALMELSLLVYEDVAKDGKAGAGETQAWHTVQRALQFVAENMRDNPSQEELAREAGTSPATLRRLFHEVLQASPKQIIDQMRFQRAVHLMADPGAKLETIGELCGFQSASAFSRAFKTHFGCSPKEWRG